MKLIYSIIIFFIFVFQSMAFEVPLTCLPTNDNNCEACLLGAKNKGEVSSLSNLSKNLNTTNSQYSLYETKAFELRNANRVLKDKLASMFRTLRDGDKEPTHVSGRAEIEKVGEDFKRLTLLTKEANHLQQKFKYCMNNCSSVRKLELLDEIKKVQKLKMFLLMGQPILANQAFEKMMGDMSEKMIQSDDFYPAAVFESTLSSALFDNLQTIIKKDYEYARFEDDSKKPDRKNISELKKYNEDLVSRFPMISEDIVNELVGNGLSNDKTKEDACYFVGKFKKYTTKKEYQEVALDVGLFALPFAFGPIGRIGEMGAEFLFGEKLLAWGLKGEQISGAMKITDISLQAGLVGHEVSTIFDKQKECQEKEVSFLTKADSSKLLNLDQCKKELSDRIFFSELSSITLATTSLSPRVIELLKSMTTKVPNIPNLPKTASLLLRDFGGGKNKVIKTEIEAMMSATKNESAKFASLSSEPMLKKNAIEKFTTQNNLVVDKKLPVQIPSEKLAEYEKTIAKDTVELLYIPGSEVPFLPNAVNKVGHIALRIGDKVYHQTGGSGFKIETFDNFIHQTKKNYKVFGQVMQVSEKEQKVMETYFQKMYDKQLPYSFLVNNCSQAVCRAMKLADFEKTNPITSHDPVATLMQLKRSERVVMKTMYNAEKDLSVEELKKATLNNRLAFYGVPAVAAGSAATGTYEAVDFVIEYLNQIKESDIKK